MIGIDDIGGEIVKCDERYVVKDNCELNTLTLSSTDLKPNKSTTGHKHLGQEEIYQFVRGNGILELGERNIVVKAGDMALIPDGVFHRVHAGDHGCYFVCVFDGNRSHK